ncbi:MAG: glycosyltransferase family 39 protein [Deltaproteobacteria bacterium]|nr:glycosyltransferase family 39 protein [Deltaproteobacteria bacterium]
MSSDKIPPRIELAIVLSLLLLGLGLRAHNLGVSPPFNETADEMAWTWSGMSLLSEGTPRAWSHLPAYGNIPLTEWRGYTYPIVSPWLDHPPLYSLWVGAYELLFDTQDPFSMDLFAARQSSLVLFVLTFFLAHQLFRRTLEPHTSLLALIALVTLPLAVASHRLVVSENLLTPIFLAIELLLIRLAESEAPERPRLGLLVILGAALVLTKLPALALVFALGLSALIKRTVRGLFALSAGATLGLSLALAWGYHFDPELFSRVLADHRARFSGFFGLQDLLFIPRIVEARIYHPVLALGVVAALVGTHRDKARSFTLLTVGYAGAMTFFVDQREIHGWYLIPTLPILVGAAARLIERSAKEGDRTCTAVLVLLSTPYLGQTLASLPAVPRETLRMSLLGVTIILALLATYDGSTKSEKPNSAKPNKRAQAIGLGLVLLVFATDTTLALLE